jgi:phosphatidylglycerol:prolipoprotein diacylglycerol transferase
MYPEICKIGPFTVYSYGLMLASAFFVGSYLAVQEAKRRNFAPDTIFNLAFIALVAGIIGARLFYVAENLSYYVKKPWEILMLERGGLSWFGGLFLASVVALVYLRKKKLPAYKTFDLIVPYLALAQAIGRIGCLLNGCCFGRTIFIPIQIYSSAILILIFMVLRFMQNRPHREGQIFFAYLLLYSLKRFFIEFWRVDNPAVFFGLTLFQLISIMVFLAAVIKLFALKGERR